MPAKTVRAPRFAWFPALSLTTIAGKPAPTGVVSTEQAGEFFAAVVNEELHRLGQRRAAKPDG